MIDIASWIEVPKGFMDDVPAVRQGKEYEMSMTLEEIGVELEKVRGQLAEQSKELDAAAEQLKEMIMIDHAIALDIKRRSHRSFRNIRDAARHLQGKPHDPFGTDKVQRSSIGYTQKIERDTNMMLAEIERWAKNQMPPGK